MEQRQHHCASFDIDAQNCFTPNCPDELPVPEGNAIVTELNYQARYARLRVGSKDAHSRDALWVADADHPPYAPMKGANMDLRWPVHAVPGTPGFELIDGLPRPAQYDYFVWKGVELDMHPYGACFHDLGEQLSTGVIEYLKTQGVTCVLAGGLALDYCVKTTALQLRDAGFDVVINLAATRGLDPRSTEEATTALRAVGVRFVDSARDLEDLDPAGPA